MALALLACAGERRAFETAVRGYDSALVTAFRTGDLTDLRRFATEKEAKKVEALVDIKREARLVLESEMTDFAVTAADASGPDGAVVHTAETWRYHDRALDPGKSPAPVYVARMTMQYELERRNGSWRVARVRTVANEFLEPKGFKVTAGGHGGGA